VRRAGLDLSDQFPQTLLGAGGRAERGPDPAILVERLCRVVEAFNHAGSFLSGFAAGVRPHPAVISTLLIGGELT
jgi:hypothetical protein